MPNEPLSTQNYVQIGDKVLNRTADASITTNDVSLSDRIFVFKKNEDGSIKTVVNTTIQYIVDAFSADATAIKNSTKEYCDGIKADTSQLKADTEALKNAAVTAKTSAESARDSAISAKNSASTSATNASNSASSASASATTATTKASEASASASSASKSATSASTSATNASSSASSAGASATSASSSASTASTKANEASTSANQAKGYRDEAKNYSDSINPDNLSHVGHKHTASDITNLLDTIYPVGSIYLTISTNPLNPSGSSPASWLGGKWVLLPADKALWTVSSGAGQTENAGLPNIKGSFVMATAIEGTVDPPAKDAFSRYLPTLVYGQGFPRAGEYWSNKGLGTITWGFDAGKYNSIYSDSKTTVQPDAYKVFAWRRES